MPHAIAIVTLLLAGAAPQGGAMQIRSPAFQAHAALPPKFTCDGAGTSPPLEFSGIPAGTQSLALIVDDPDAPDPKAPKTTWVHWVLYAIPPDAKGLPEGAADGELPKGTRVGLNDWKNAGWGAACPPMGQHRYFFKLYALDAALPNLGHPTKAALEKAMRGHVLAHAELVGTYQKH